MAETQPYGSAAQLYTAAGWPAVLPVPPETKTPPPAGFTGEHGRDPSPGEYALWTASMPHWSVALRMPDGVIGIDVDDYAKGSTQKRGAATLAHFEQLWGPLPATWSSTARGDGSGPGASRIMFFRCPPGRYRSMLGPDVEIIQRHHRYAVVAPSWHHDVSAPYCWYTPAGACWEPRGGMLLGGPLQGGAYPGPGALTDLPERWVQGLREGAAVAGALPAPEQAGHQMLNAIQSEIYQVNDPPSQACAEVYSAALKARDVLGKADPGSRHDQTAARVHALVMLGAKGHPGAGAVLAELGEMWERLTAGEGRSGEFERMLLTSARKAVTEVGRSVPLPGDPCLLLYQGRVSGGLSSPGQAIPPAPEVGIFTGGSAHQGSSPDLPPYSPQPLGALPQIGSPGPPAPWGNAGPGSWNGHASPGRVSYTNGTAPLAAGVFPGLPPATAGPFVGLDHTPVGGPLDANGNPAQPAAGPATPHPAAGPPAVLRTAAEPGAPGELGQPVHELPAAGAFNPVAAVGTGPFDPPTMLDQPLADAVLERTAPVLRFATDSRDWVIREGIRWDARPDLAGWAVGFLARFAPAGDPGAEKGTPEAMRAARRVRLLSTAGRNAVAAAMRDVVRAGGHPCALRVEELDTDPEVLWAGGLSIDLAASVDVPRLAATDPAAPHLHTAPCLPVPGPTPLWDAYVAAVWPDPEVRAWALRVLSVALTGYADATMPVMVGPRDRGKTQVIELVLSVLGTYGIAANPKLLNSGDNSHDTIVYALKGARLAFVDEGPRSGHLAQERLKQLTGGGRLTGREVGKGEVRWTPTHTLVLTANEEPNLTDPALRKRVRLIPCEGDVDAIRTARRAIGPLHKAAWQAEQPAVLAALVVQAARWLADRDSATTEAAPASIRYRADELAAEQDPIGLWVADETEPWEQGTPVAQLYKGFVSWWRETGRSAGSLPSVVKWGRELTNLGHPSKDARFGTKVVKTRPLRLQGAGPGGGWGFQPPAPQPPPLPITTASVVGIPAGHPANERWNQTSQDEMSANSSAVGILPAQPESSTQTKSNQTNTDTPYVNNSAARSVSVAVPATPIGNTTSNTKSKVEVEGVNDLGVAAEPATVAPLWPGPATQQTPTSSGESEPLVASVASLIQESQSISKGGNTKNIGLTKGETRNKQHVATAQEGEQTPAQAAKTAEREHRNEQRKASKAAKREAARLAAIEVAAGLLVTLPAVLDRQTQSVTSVSVAEARRIVAEEVAAWGGKLTLDVETTGYPIGHPDYALRTAQLGSAARVVDFDTDDPEQAAAVAELVACAPYLEAHSAPADLVPLAHAGLGDADSMWARMWDTVIPAKLADPQQTGADPSLKAVAPAVLGGAALSPAAEQAREAVFKAGKWLTDVEPTTPAAKSGWAMIDKRCTTMVRYAGSDVLDTAAIGHLVPQPGPELWDRERTAQRAVARIAHDGLRLNADRVRELTEQHRAACAELAPVIESYGIDNPGSPAQVAAALAQLGAALPLTPGGKPSAARGVLEPLRRSEGLVGHLASAVLDWRHADTALNLFLRPWQILVDYDPADPRIRSTVYTLSADTGRMSCVRFNLQQLSRQGGIRSCIEAWPGYVLVSADFQGVEVRTMAGLSQDPTLIRLLINGRSMCPELAQYAPYAPERYGQTHDEARCGWCTGDLHRLIAATTYGPGWTKEDRYNVKRGVFGWAYGGSVPSLAAQIAVTQSEMQSIVDVLGSIAPTYVDWAAAVKQGVRRGITQFPTYSGRVVHLDKRQPHKAPNYEIQGTARELLVDALIRWYRGPYGRCITVPVHDEILAMVPEDRAEHATQYLQECMTNSLYGVPIVAEASTPSTYWADAS